GLRVRNRNGDEWTAYGDGYYLDAKSEPSRTILQQIMQLSADEIYFAYQHGIDPNEGSISEQINNLLPQVVVEGSVNTAPLFLWDSEQQALQCRTDINDLYCYEWTATWWGWTTLAELAEYYQGPLPAKKEALHRALAH
ncbi:MAG: hypothetical protein JSR46_07600, partial [Verrucomicrobia bacterium]|nr:hypothetical protein [Verrucomicrobiota bacterium]